MKGIIFCVLVGLFSLLLPALSLPLDTFSPPAAGAAGAATAGSGLCADLLKEKADLSWMERRIENYQKEVDEAQARLDNLKQTYQNTTPADSEEVKEIEKDLAGKTRELTVTRNELNSELAKSQPATAVDLSAIKKTRDDKKARYQQALAIQKKVDEAPEVEQVKERIDKTKEEIEAEVGSVSFDNLAQLDQMLQQENYDPKWERDHLPPRLYRLQRSIEDPQINSYPDKVKVLEGQVKELLGNARKKVADLGRLISTELPEARRKAEERLTPEERKILRDFNTIKKEYDDAEEAVQKAEGTRASGEEQRRQEAYIESLKERIKALEGEESSLKQALEAAKKRASGPAKEIQDAEAALGRAKRNLEGTISNLERTKKKVEGLEIGMGQLEEEIKSQVAAGKKFGSAAYAVNTTNKEDCLKNLAYARNAFRIARVLLEDNRECLDKNGSKLQKLNEYFQNVDSISCQGEYLPLAPDDSLIEVPNVIGMPKDSAVKTLNRFGLNAFPYEYLSAPSRDLSGKVSGQNPRPGDRVKPGHAVSISHYGDYVPPPPTDTGSGSSSSSTTSTTTTGGFSSSGRSTDLNSQPNPLPSQPDPVSSATGPASAFMNNAISAINSCDFDRALRNADMLASSDPRHPWLKDNYGRIIEGQKNMEAASNMIQMAQGILSRADPSNEDISYAVSLLKNARGIAPPCMSSKVSALTPAMNNAIAAVEQREKAKTEQERKQIGEALGTLLTGIAGVIAATQSGGSQPGSGTTVDPNFPGAVAGSDDCNGCVIARYVVTQGQVGNVNYIFARDVRFYKDNRECNVTVYYLHTLSPKDENDRPLNYWPDEANVRMGLNAYTVCGPCGSYQQAESILRSRCPNPLVKMPQANIR